MLDGCSIPLLSFPFPFPSSLSSSVSTKTSSQVLAFMPSSLYRLPRRQPPMIHRRTPLAPQQGGRNRSRTICTAHTRSININLTPPASNPDPGSRPRFLRSCHCSYTLVRSGESLMHFPNPSTPHRSAITPNQSPFGVECISHTAFDHLSTSLLIFTPEDFKRDRLWSSCDCFLDYKAQYGHGGCSSGSPLQHNLSTRMGALSNHHSAEIETRGAVRVDPRVRSVGMYIAQK